MSRTDASEGDVNTSPARAAWTESLDAPTRAILARDEAVFFRQALSTPCLDAIVAAQGSILTDAGGRRLFDFHGNSVHQVGHGHPRVLAAVEAALRQLPFSPRRFTNELAIELATRLVGLAPMQPAKLLFAPSGAAAVSMALKLARHATGRHKTLSMWDAFHGANLDTISVGGEAIFRHGAGPLLPGAEHVPPPSMAARFFGDDGRAHERLADYIDYVLAVQGDVAAVIAEPVRWTTLEAPPAGFWPRVRESCTRHGALLIFDEIPSCLGRTGEMFATTLTGAVPDILVIGKGLGGGVFPMAAMLARADLDVVADGALGHYTHEKSPVGAAAALAVLDIIADEDLLARARRLGAAALKRLTDLQHRDPRLSGARGLGLSLAIDIVGDADAVLYRALAGGLSFKIGAGRTAVLTPPLTIEEPDLDAALVIFEQAVDDARGS